MQTMNFVKPPLTVTVLDMPNLVSDEILSQIPGVGPLIIESHSRPGYSFFYTVARASAGKDVTLDFYRSAYDIRGLKIAINEKVTGKRELPAE